MKRFTTLFAMSIALLMLFCCFGCNDKPSGSQDGTDEVSGAPPDFHIVSGSENRSLEPIIQRFASQNNLNIKVDYRGSVEIMMLMQEDQISYDAVWPANTLWIDLGDRKKRIKEAKSIFWSPVVFGVKKSVAQSLGWVNKKNIKVADILQAAESGKVRFMMTSATQSNSGACAYLGFLNAFAGNPDVLTMDDIYVADTSNPTKKKRVDEVTGKVKRLLASVNRSSGSSGFLKDLFLEKYEAFDAMFNYESIIIETNQALIQQGKEPLYVVYPADGLAVADSPLGYVDNGDDKKAETFQKLQEYLLSPPIQQETLQQGRRVGTIGEAQTGLDKNVYRDEWGMGASLPVNQIRYPSSVVITKALELYQSLLRKPSLTVYCLDFSGSMRGDRIQGLKDAMRMILNQENARKAMLQASDEDFTSVVLFSDRILAEYDEKGKDPTKLNNLWAEINKTEPDGGTAIHMASIRGMDIIKQKMVSGKYFPAIILLTDGESNTGPSFEDFANHVRSTNTGQDIPIYAILFGEASTDQLNQLTEATFGKVFDGKKDLLRAFREAKGYN